MMELEPPQLHGWNDDCSLTWPAVIVPEDVVRSIDEDLDQDEENEMEEYDTDSEDESPNEEDDYD